MIRSKRQIDDLRHSAVPALCTMSVSCGSMHLATGYKYDLLRPALSGSRNLLSQGRTYSTYGSSPKKAVLHLTCQAAEDISADTGPDGERAWPESLIEAYLKAQFQIRYEEEMAKRPQPDLEHRPWQRAVKNLPATVEEPESGSSASQMQALQQHAERACVVYMAVIEAQSVMTVNEADVLDWCKQHLEHQWDLREKTERQNIKGTVPLEDLEALRITTAQ